MKLETKPQALNWIQSSIRGEPVDCKTLTEPEWGLIWDSARENGVIPLVHYSLTESGAWDSCPPFVQKQLSSYSYQSAAMELLRQHDLKETLELFTNAGIDYLLMKGAPLSVALYPQAHLRERCDTDILFASKEVAETAWKILQEIGYERRNTTSGEFVGYQFSCSREVSHGFTQALDMHSKLNDYEFFANTFTFAELYLQSTIVTQLSETAHALNPVHALLLACMHRVAHIPRGEGNRLIWLYDMHLLSTSFSDSEWQAFCELAQEKAIAGVCLDSLQTTQEYFHTELPQIYLNNLSASAKEEKVSPHEKGKRWEFYYLAFKSTPGVANKLKQLREHFLPSTNYMMKKYQPKYRILLPYYYVYRVVAGIKRYF